MQIPDYLTPAAKKVEFFRFHNCQLKEGMQPPSAFMSTNPSMVSTDKHNVSKSTPTLATNLVSHPSQTNQQTSMLAADVIIRAATKPLSIKVVGKKIKKARHHQLA